MHAPPTELIGCAGRTAIHPSIHIRNPHHRWWRRRHATGGRSGLDGGIHLIATAVISPKAGWDLDRRLSHAVVPVGARASVFTSQAS